MTRTSLRRSAFILTPLILIGAGASVRPAHESVRAGSDAADHHRIQAGDSTLKIQYLEIVTPALDETCATLAAVHGIEFSDPVPEFGSARTAELSDGGRIGVRAPMRATEAPVVRPYALVDDIDAAVKAAEESGATIALPPIEIPGQGTFSIYILGGIEHGLWEL